MSIDELSERVQRWKGLAQSELDRLGAPIPVEWVLAIIRRESNGEPGVVNPKSGATGLMQVMSIAVRDYNQHHNGQYTMDYLRGSPVAQIRVGIYCLVKFLKMSFSYLKKRISHLPLDDLVKVTDTFYASGPKNSRSRLDKINPTWNNIVSNFPSWDRIKPAELVWKRANDWGASWDLKSIDQWLESNFDQTVKKNMGGALLAIFIIVAAWRYFKGTK